jgi:hypothetical protein
MRYLLAGIIAGITSILIFGLIVVLTSKNPEGDPHVGWSILIIYCILLAITNTVTIVISYLILRRLRTVIYSHYGTLALIFGISFLCMTVFILTLTIIKAAWHNEVFFLAAGAFLVGLISETVQFAIYKRMMTT